MVKWVTIAAYVVLLVIVGVVTGRKSKSIADLTVGGRNAGAWLSAMSYGAAYFSAVMFVGYAGSTGYSFGLWGILAGLGNAIFGSYFAWKVLARRTRKLSSELDIKTMPQIFEKSYGSDKMKIFSCIVIFVFMVPYSASVYKGLGSVSKVLLGIDDTAFMIIIAVLAVVLLLLGGYLVQARADFIQGIIMMIGVSLLIFFVIRSDKVGGAAGLMEYAKSAEGLPKLGASQWLALMSTVLMTSFGTWGLPQMVSKYFGIRDDGQAKRGITISTVFGFLVAGGGYFIGSLCHKFYTAADYDVMTQNHGSTFKDFIVPYMLNDSKIPEVLLGVVIVLLLAASISTLCSVTLTACSALSLDFIKGTIKKDMSEKNSKILMKALCVVFIAVSYFVANSNTPILDMMSYSWGIISGSFFAPYLFSLYTKKLSKGGAWAGVLTGFLTALIPAVSKIITLFGVTNETVVSLAGKGPHFACLAMALSLAVCAVCAAAGKNTAAQKN